MPHTPEATQPRVSLLAPRGTVATPPTHHATVEALQQTQHTHHSRGWAIRQAVGATVEGPNALGRPSHRGMERFRVHAITNAQRLGD